MDPQDADFIITCLFPDWKDTYFLQKNDPIAVLNELKRDSDFKEQAEIIERTLGI